MAPRILRRPVSGCGRLIVPVLAATTVLAAPPERQSVAEELRRERIAADLEKYRALLDAYRRGNQESVSQIVEWEWKRLEELIGALGGGLDVQESVAADRLKAAAMFHTDAALRFLNHGSPAVAFHLDFAGRLLHEGDPLLRRFSSGWYATCARVLRDRALLDVAEPFLERGRERLPGDAILLFESAMLQEHIASFAAFDRQAPPSQGPIDSRRFPMIVVEFDRNERIAARRRSLNKAAEWLEASLKPDSSSTNVTLHLGRVQMLRGNEGQALRLLQTVKKSSDVSAAYLATLFIGAIHERRDRLSDAEAAYREALDRLPSGQSAYLALSQVLQRLGRGGQSREVLARLLARPRDDTTEPWWWYLADRPDDIRRRLDALRESVRIRASEAKP